MPSAARVSDLHVCSMVNPGPVPHIGGPIIGPGISSVVIDGMNAAVVGDLCVCMGPPDVIATGSTSVTIGGRAAARRGDLTVHGGAIVGGCSTVIIG